MLLNLLKNTKKNHLIAISLIAFFPLLVFFGSGIINLTIIFLDFIFLYELYRVKRLDYLKNKFFYLLLFLWLILLINLFFNINFNNSFSRSFGFCRFIFFAFALKFYIFDEHKDYKKYIFSIWTVIFLIISLDLIFEFIFGKNILGFESYMPGRLSGFFNQELKIGYIYSFLSLVILTFLYLKFKHYKINTNFIYIIFFIILFISFIIGERANFIKTFLMFFFFLFLFEKKFFKIKLTLISVFCAVFVSIITFSENNNYKHRFWGTFLKPIINNPTGYLQNSSYADHYYAAYNVFKNYKFFGVGLKNYRIEVSSGNYGKNTSTHPHEKHLELLSETGLLGYFSFTSFFIFSIINGIRLFLNNKNLYQLSGLLFITTNLIPLIPSGSLFTTYTGTLFWFSFAFMIYSSKKN